MSPPPRCEAEAAVEAGVVDGALPAADASTGGGGDAATEPEEETAKVSFDSPFFCQALNFATCLKLLTRTLARQIEGWDELAANGRGYNIDLAPKLR